MSNSCTNVTDIAARKDTLRKAGRCYICLRKHHRCKDCRSNFSCRKCRGRHHVSICPHQSSQQGNTAPAPLGLSQGSSDTPPSSQGSIPRSTNAMYIGAQTPILLQTARLQLFKLSTGKPCIVARAIMDSGSKRTYITCRLRDQFNLLAMGTESLRIKTFGTTETHDTSCDVIQFGLKPKEGGTLKVTALVVPFICNPLTLQPINYSKKTYDHLLGLELADSADVSDILEIDMLIGSDSYWDLATGQVIRGDGRPTAIHTKVGWILLGPAKHLDVTVNLTFASTHTLRIDVYPAMELTLEDCQRQFWDLESLGIVKKKPWCTTSSYRGSNSMQKDMKPAYHGRSATLHFSTIASYATNA